MYYCQQICTNKRLEKKGTKFKPYLNFQVVLAHSYTLPINIILIRQRSTSPGAQKSAPGFGATPWECSAQINVLLPPKDRSSVN